MKKKINKKYNKKKPTKDRKVNNKPEIEKKLSEGIIPRFEGKVVTPMRDILLSVCLDHNNEIVLGYLSGNIRRHRIKVVLGDKVLIELADNTSKKGRIVYRLPRKRVLSPNQQAFTKQLENDYDQEVKEEDSNKDIETKNKESSNPLKWSNIKEDDEKVKEEPSNKDIETRNKESSNPLKWSNIKEKKKIERKEKPK